MPALAGPEPPSSQPAAAWPAPHPPAPEPAPWGPVVTLLLTFAVLAVYAVVQSTPLLFGLTGSRPAAPPAPVPGGFGLPPMPNTGFLFALGTILGAPLGMALIVLLARSRRGLSAARYLGLRRPALRDLLLGVLLLALFTFTLDALSAWLGRPEVPAFMVEAFRTAVYLPVLWVAVVVAAPAFEELMFRGFLIEGLRRSRAGALGAALLSSLLFAVIHLQYDLFDMTAIFTLGMLFAFVRLKSGSTLLAMGLHALTNLVAMAQVAWTLRQG